MSKVGDGINKVRAKLDAKASKILADACNIILLTPTSDDFGGSTNTPTTVASNVPCSYKPLRQPITKLLANGTSIDLTQELTLPANAITQAIDDSNRIDVLANGITPAFSLAGPTVMQSSLAPFVIVAAYLGK